MTVQTINIGNVVNDGLGDDLRTAFQKVNANFATLDSQLTVTVSNLGTGVGIFKQRTGADLEFKSLVAFGGKIAIDSNEDTIAIRSTAPDSFTMIETDSGTVTASPDQLGITFSGIPAPGSVSGIHDLEVTASGSTVYFKTRIPVTDILTIYDFGGIIGTYDNTMQFALASSNIDFGTIILPGRLDLDCGTIV